MSASKISPSPTICSNVGHVSPNNHLVMSSPLSAEIEYINTNIRTRERRNSLSMRNQTSSPLTPLPPLEHPSSFSFSPEIVKLIRRTPSVRSERRQTFGSITPPSGSKTEPKSSQSARIGRVSMLPVRPPRHQQLVKVQYDRTPQRSSRTRRSHCNEKDCSSPKCLKYNPDLPKRTQISVQEFLLKVKLQHLIPMFEREEIDLMVLLALTSDDMKILGICDEDRKYLMLARKRCFPQLQAEILTTIL